LRCYGRYILIERLGVGGMAEVFRALATGPGLFRRQVVIKRILPQFSHESRFIRMFMDEATISGRLQHPNIVQVHDFGEEDNAFFLVMEHVHGAVLMDILTRLKHANRLMPTNVVAEIGRQACLGLAHAHTLADADGTPLNIVHRDISPSNLMVSFAGAVKVLDFGIAKMVATMRLTETTGNHQFKGKAAYLAPEQVRGDQFDSQADIFALGIVLHEALTGKRLFRTDSPSETAALIISKEIPKPSTLNKVVPPALDAIVMRALERDVRLRYQSATQMARALDAFLADRRFSSQALQQFMTELYEGETAEPPQPSDAEIQAVLDEAARERAESAPVPAPMPAMSSGPHSAPIAMSPEQAVMVARGSASMTAAPEPPPQRMKPLRVAGLVVWALLLGLGVMALAMIWRRPAPLPAPARVAPPAPAPRAEAIPLPAPVPPPAEPVAARPAALVQLTVTSLPAGADVLRLPAKRVLGQTPLVFSEPQGQRAVELQIGKAGFTPVALQIVPDGDHSLVVTLSPQTAAKKAMKPAASSEESQQEAAPGTPAVRDEFTDDPEPAKPEVKRPTKPGKPGKGEATPSSPSKPVAPPPDPFDEQ
jgi:serine/threonine-protein kinase